MIPLLSLVITLAIYGLVFYILYWGLGKLAIGEPFKTIAMSILIIAAMIVTIGLLVGFVHPIPLATNWR